MVPGNFPGHVLHGAQGSRQHVCQLRHVIGLLGADETAQNCRNLYKARLSYEGVGKKLQHNDLADLKQTHRFVDDNIN